jgi:outer membrane cobalamin receptor
VARIYGEYRISEGVRLTGRIENAFDTDWQYSRFPFSSPVNAPGFGIFSGIEIAW